jgi:hypothetical protein
VYEIPKPAGQAERRARDSVVERRALAYLLEAESAPATRVQRPLDEWRRA